MQEKTYSMNTSGMTDEEIDEALSQSLNAIVKGTDLWKEKQQFHREVTEALINILRENELTIFDVWIKREDSICEVADMPTKVVEGGQLLEGPIDIEVVKIYNLRSKDSNGNYELLYENEYQKDVKIMLYSDRTMIKNP
jgi:hypothetical protein